MVSQQTFTSSPKNRNVFIIVLDWLYTLFDSSDTTDIANRFLIMREYIKYSALTKVFQEENSYIVIHGKYSNL